MNRRTLDRLERNHGRHQDRLVKKLRRKDIATNAAMGTTYTEEQSR
jgi:hypothetical protein